MKLYGSLTSPYVRKVRIILKEKDIPCEFIVEDPWAANSVIPALNPLGKVPVLQLNDGRILFDSSLIIEYLDAVSGAPLLPAEGPRRWDVLRWHALAQGIVDAVIARLLETRRPAEKQLVDTITRQEEKIARALAYADHAEKGQAYLLNDAFNLADLALGVALEYIDFRYPHPWRDNHPRLGHWLAGITTRPSFAETRPPGMERTVESPH